MLKIDLNSKIILTTQEALDSLAQQLNHSWSQPSKISVYFPSSVTLRSSIDLNELETPWEDFSFEGVHISAFRMAGLRILEKCKGRVLWSKELREVPLETILQHFFETIERGLLYVGPYLHRKTNDGLIYLDETVTGLLKASFCDKEKPRLIPRIEWPKESECIEVTRKLIPVIPASKHKLKEDLYLWQKDGTYFFEVTDERGNIGISKTWTDQMQMRLFVFRYLMRVDYINTDANFTFKPYFL